MEASSFFIQTLKETPADAEIASHQLLIKAGYIKKLSSGIYTWLPMGLRVLRNIEKIVRQEMEACGAVEILMPTIQPASIWQETDRWEGSGKELLKIKDRHDKDFCFGPTHEEVVTDLARKSISSYKQLPVILYQIQTKFRDEIRPRFGVIRSREFIMKDAYSFHKDEESIEDTYFNMYDTYNRIFQRIGLRFRAVLADSGNIGGKLSHEFHVLTEQGEDTIAFCNNSDYAANVEYATSTTPAISEINDGPMLTQVATPASTTIEAICNNLEVNPDQTIKTILIEGIDHPIVACIIRGDHTLNETKIAKNPLVKSPITFASPELIAEHIGCNVGFIGPVNLTVPMIIDHHAAALDDFICGANVDGYHLIHCHWGRDCHLDQLMDIREVEAGDPSPDGKGELQLEKGIEVGHIFQLGNKYSQSMQAKASDENGKDFTLLMGCYGIGISRVVAATIEQNNDENGIIWPEHIAPFQVHIIPMNYHKSEAVKDFSDMIYKKLSSNNIDVLLDNRNLRAGALFADADLIGIPHQIIIGERNLAEKKLEYKNRRDGNKQLMTIDELMQIFDKSEEGVAT